MFKKIGLFFIVVLAIAVMGWSGNYIYNKQSKGIDFNNFIVTDSAAIFYLPNANQLLAKQVSPHFFNKFNFPSTLKDAFSLFSSRADYDFNTTISREIYISYDETDFSLVFKNYSLSIDHIIKELSNELDITAIATNGALKINETSYFYSKNGDFFIFSNQEINTKKSVGALITNGNFDYSFQINSQIKPTFYRHNWDELYSFSKTENDSINGTAVNPVSYFKNIPDNFDELYFYGSTRLEKDVDKLIGNQNESNFYTWAKNSIVHLKKDSFEIIIGIQNNDQNLKYILDEQTLELSNDSLLPTSIFKNNFEVSFFKSKYNWKTIVPESNTDFSVYTELNNFNILANSTKAIDWFIKQMQLGNNYYAISKSISIPTKVNKLHIDQRTDNPVITIDNWINKSIRFHSTIDFEKKIQKTSSSLPLVSNFSIKNTNSKLAVLSHNDSLYIMLYSDKNIDCYDKNGNLRWTKELPSILIKSPSKIILKNNSVGMALFMENQINIINSNGNSLSGFPYQYNGASKDGLVLKYDNTSDYRILININNTILNLNLSGDPVEGWNFNPFIGSLKSKIQYSKTNGKDYIYFKDSKDSLYVLNRKGEHRFDKHYYSKTIQSNEYITGDINQGNLRLLNYEDGYIKSLFLLDGHRDSLLLNHNKAVTKTKWMSQNEKVTLLIEEFDKVIVFNEFGIKENEIQKPEANINLLSEGFLNSKYIVFGNLPKNELYLLNSFGTQINTKPILGKNNFAIIDSYFIVDYNSQIWIYELN